MAEGPNVNITEHALDLAGSQVGVREHGGPNCGPEVAQYLWSVSLPPGQPWCAAFVSWCWQRAAFEVGIECPLIVSGSALHLWAKAPPEQQTQEPERGAIFVIDHGGGKGHCGLVEHVDQGAPGDLVTLEGNTNASGGREGDGVYRRVRKLPIPGLVGYIVPARSLGAIPQSEA